VLVLDTSGSMAGQKIQQAKSALGYIFKNLNSEDRFSLITFSTDVYPYFDGLRDASRDNIADVTDFINGIEARGSTNINEAMKKALGMTPDHGRPMYIIFVSDGLPTVGETNTAKIIENVNAENSKANARIFSFGVGDDVDYQFIDRLSRENGGSTSNAAPNEDLEQPLSDFYSKIKSPVMTDVAVDISGVRIYEMLPDKMPDLFLGSQLILTGRYNGSGDGNVKLTGKIGDKDVTYNYPVSFKQSRENKFIPRHWATRRVGYLLNQVRLYGENKEVVDEIVGLAKQYGIITPYTSMLVTEDEVRQPHPPMPTHGAPGFGVGGAFGRAKEAAPMAPPRAESSQMKAMEDKANAGEAPGNVGESVRYAGEKTFYLNADGYWEDSTFADSKLSPVEIPYLSKEYYDLLANEPDIADYLAVADKVIVVWKDKAYKIVPNPDAPSDAAPASPN
jgi:Ca-activated chloride channel family protein